jgi:hypothetical protein
MNARVLRDFLEDRIQASVLSADLRDAFEQTSVDSFRLHMTDLTEDFAVRPEHLVKLCDAVLTGQLDAEALRAIGFGMIASDHFDWDGEAPGGAAVAKTLHDWASPEANYGLSPRTVAKFKHRLLTGEDTFTHADAVQGGKRRTDDWSSVDDPPPGAPPLSDPERS